MPSALDKILDGLGDPTKDQIALAKDPTFEETWTRDKIAEIAYWTNPAISVDVEEQDDRTPRADEQQEAYGESPVSWEQAISNQPQEYHNALAKADEILQSRIPQAELIKFVGRDAILGEMGDFTYMWGQDFFVETRFGNFHWKDPGYDGDNSFAFFEGSYADFCAQHKVQFGRDKGKGLILNRCGENITLLIPQLD